MRSSLCILGFAAVLTMPAAAAVQRRPTAAPQAQQPAPQAQQPARPQPTRYPTRVTSKALIAVCNENNAACLTYVLGAVDAYVATTVASFGQPRICFPAQLSNQQIANVAVAYLHAHPEQQDANAATAVILGVQAAYPCRSGAPAQ